jgi:hypothetical protein
MAAKGISGVALKTPGIIKAPMAVAGIHFKKASTLVLIVLLDKNRKGSNRGVYVTTAMPRIRGIRLLTGSLLFDLGVGL